MDILKISAFLSILLFASNSSAISDGEGLYSNCENRILAKYSGYRKATRDGRDTFDYFDVVYLYKHLEDSVSRRTVTQEEAITQIARFMQSRDFITSKIARVFRYSLRCDDANATLIIQYSRNEEENLDYMRIEIRNHKIIGMSEEWEDYASNFDFTEWPVELN